MTIVCYIVVPLNIVTVIYFTNNFMKDFNKYIKEYNISLKKQLEIIYHDKHLIKEICIYSFVTTTVMIVFAYLMEVTYAI